MTMNDSDERRTNWAHSLTYSAREQARPRSIDELSSIAASSDLVHALGTRHSFSDVADTAGVLVDISGLPSEIDIDESSGTVAVNAAATYGKVAPALDLAGFALHNEGSLPHISVAGATATGTHGSGSELGPLSTVVRALEILGSDGAVRTLNHDSVDFPGAVIHLGLLVLRVVSS